MSILNESDTMPLISPSFPRKMTETEHSGGRLEGCNLCWSNVYVQTQGTKLSVGEKFLTSRKPERGKDILYNISGVSESGKLLAIMGSSGAGKTTLLNVLTSRNLNGLDVQGSVMLDGQRVSKWRIREISAFVQQHDMFVGTLTVREHLQFMAKLRMGPIHTKWERNCRVEEVIRKMGLTSCADTLIGLPNMKKGLSSGEKKRLAFASEILTCPQILFCDEPTSGLDAFMAGQVVQALRELAQGGMTVIITIHQPSSQVFSLFDSLCLMADGRSIYLGRANEAVPFFEKCGFPCPAFFNPADHLIRTLAITDQNTKKSLKTIARIREEFLESDHGKTLHTISGTHKDHSQRSHLSDRSDDYGTTFFRQSYTTSFPTQFSALCYRAWLQVIRNPVLLRVQMVQMIINALITGTVYFNIPITPTTIMTINGVLFAQTRAMNTWQFPCVPVIGSELPIFLRENANGMYRTSAYFLAKNCAELPQYIFLPLVYNIIVYWMAGLYPNLWTFLYSCLIVVVGTNLSISISYAVATVFGNLSVAMTVLPVFVIPMMAFGGYFINFESIPSYFTWLSALSYFKYGYETLAVNEWQNVGVIEGCLNATTSLAGCPRNGEAALSQLNFSAANKWPDMIIMVGMIVGIRSIAYIALLIRSYKNQ